MNTLAKNIIIGGDDNNRNEDFEDKALDFFQTAKDMAHKARKIHIRNEKQTKRIRELENEVYSLKQKLQSYKETNHAKENQS